MRFKRFVFLGMSLLLATDLCAMDPRAVAARAVQNKIVIERDDDFAKATRVDGGEFTATYRGDEI